MGLRARASWFGAAVWIGSAGLAGAQVQSWATRYDSGLVAAQEARVGAGDPYRGKHALVTDTLGGTYATGTIDKSSDTDCLTVKYDSAGAVVWSAVYDGGSSDACYAVVVDEAGGVYVAGSSATIKYDAVNGNQLWVSPATGVALAWDGSGLVVAGVGAVRRLDAAGVQQWAQTLPGEARAVAVAGANTYVALVDVSGANADYGTRVFDSSGALVWSRLYNGAGNGADEVHDIGVDGSGAVYVTGRCANATNGDACTVKYDAAGTQQWAVAYNNGNEDTGNALVVDAAGGAFVAGTSRNGATDDFLTIRYDTGGTSPWVRLFNGGSADEAYAITRDAAGALWVTGPSEQGSSFDYRIVKYSAAGAQLTTATHNVPPNRYDVSFALAVDTAGNVVVGGFTERVKGGNQGTDFRLVKYNSGGNEQWGVGNPLVNVDAEDAPTQRGAMAVDGSGNVYVLGRSFNGQNTDYKVVKHGPTGLVTGVATVAGFGTDVPEALALDTAGNVYVTGTSATNGSGGDNFLTVKYDATGAELWSRAHNSGDTDQARALAVDGAGNVYVAGQSLTPTGYQYRTVKYTTAGNQLWFVSTGAAGDDVPTAITVDAAGNVYVTGTWFNGSNLDVRTVKYNAAGAQQWNVVHNGPANGADVPTAIAVDATGNVYVTGSSQQGATGIDFLTVAYNPAGGVLWTAAYDGGANGDDAAVDMALDATGNVYVGGTATSPATGPDFAVVKYDPAGAQQWAGTSSHAGGDTANDLTTDAAGSLYVTGKTATPNGLDYRTVKFNAAGAEMWAVTFTGPGNRDDRAVAVAVDSLANVYVTGSSRDQSGVDFVTIKYIQDATAPTNPTVTSTSHVPSAWSNLGTIAMQWSGAADEVNGSGLAGYSHLFDLASATAPDTTVDTAHAVDPHTTGAALVDGNNHYFHLRTCDAAGNCAAPIHAGPYFIDLTNPGAPTGLASSSHAISTPSGDRTIDISWSAAVDPLVNGVASGIDGYSYFFDGSATASCDLAKDVEENVTVAMSASLANGSWYAHVCAVDNAGNWSVLANAGPFVIHDQADLSIAKTDSADPVNAGASFSYTLAVSNAGPITAQSVVVTDTLPAGLTFVSATGTNWACGEASGTVTCTRASLTVGPAEPITVVVNAPAQGGSVTNTATVASSTSDPAAANDIDGETTDVTAQADLSIAKTASGNPVNAGANFSYTLAVSNAGPSTAQSLTVTDVLPAGLTFVSATGANWLCGETAGTVTCTHADLAVGAAEPITIVVTAPAEGGVVTNTASVSTTTADPAAANNSDGEITDVTAQADLSIAKTASGNPVNAGANFSYTLAVSNAGPSTAQGLTVTDALPSGLTFVSATGANWACSETAGTVTCTHADLAVGAAEPITIVVTAPAEGGVVTNTASVSTTTNDPAAANNSDGETTDVTAQADLSIAKTASGNPVNAGANFSYTLTISNAGPSTAQGLTVTDTLPAGLTFVSATGTNWSCTETAGTVTCTHADLAVGAAEPITIAVTAPAEGGSVTNTASVSTTTNDPAAANNSDGETTDVTAQADLSIAKSDSVDPVAAGANFTYTLAVSNAGPSTAQSLTVTDTLPAGLTFGSATGTNWLCNETAGTVTCTHADLAVGAAEPITIVVTAPAEGGSVTNTASVSTTTNDPAAANNSDGETTDVTAQADLSIAKTDSVDPVDAGANFTYTLAVSNAGPSTAQGLTVTDTLPAGLTFVSATGTNWLCNETAGTVTCTHADLAVGAAEPITIAVTAPAEGGSVTNTASVSTTTNDPAAANNSDGETTDVTAQADLSIAKSDSVDPVAAGANFSYTLAVSNAGPSTAQSLTVTDTLPAGLTFVSATGTNWLCSETAGTVTCTRTSLTVGAAEPVTLTVTAPAQGGSVSNTASVSSATSDPAAANDSDGETTDVSAQADLSIVKTDSVDPVNAGAGFTYTLAVTNAGPSTAQSLTVTDVLPAGLTFVSATGANWTCGETAGTVTCTHADLAVGAAEPITIAVTAPAEGGSVTNTASVSTTTTDPASANDSDGETTDVTAQADLSIAKSDSVDPVNAGASFSYTLTVSNAGPSTAQALTVTDTLPVGLTFVSATGANWTCGETAGTVTCTRPSLAVGAAEPITIAVTAPAEGGSITNTASVATTTNDPAAANNTDGETTDVTAQADLSVTKTDGQTSATPGQPVTYTITVSNAGPSTVTGGTVVDALPAELQGATWTCTASAGSGCTASGSGNINDTVNVLAGGSLVYSLTATVGANATGTLANTATVAVPAGVVDPALANNSATDTDSLAPQADLSVTKTDGQTVVVPGQALTYTITLSNLGPSAVTGATVTDTLPAALQNGAWTCAASAGSACTASGSGNIQDTVDLLAGGNATYTLTATVASNASGSLVNTATVTAPATANDPDPTNDSASDTDSVVNPLAVEAELGHGSRLVADLASLGTNADEDRFRLYQDPYSSYEVTVDAASGDLGADGPVLELLAADGVTVLQSSRPVGTGSARTLRFMNTTASPVGDQWVRVKSAGCASDCGTDDTYRIRAWETSGRLARFNNSGSQITILLLQNPTTETIAGTVYFWSAAGTLAGEAPVSLGAHQLMVLNTATVAPGQSGSVTVAHDGPFGGLVGKTVALEPATGFSFDSPMTPRLR